MVAPGITRSSRSLPGRYHRGELRRFAGATHLRFIGFIRRKGDDGASGTERGVRPIARAGVRGSPVRVEIPVNMRRPDRRIPRGREVQGSPVASGRRRRPSVLGMPRSDRVETVSREREPSAIRDPAKWTTVHGTFGYREVKPVYPCRFPPAAATRRSTP